MNTQSTHDQKVSVIPYVLEFARFVSVFIVIIGVALSLMYTISVAAAGNQAPSSAMVLGVVK